MDPTAFVSFLPPQYHAAAAALIGLAGAAWVFLKAVDICIQVALRFWPNVRALQVADHWIGSLATRWPKSLLPPGQPPPAGTIAGAVQPPPRGFASLPVLTLLSALAVGWPGLLVLVTGAWAVYAVAYLALSIRRSASRADPASYWIRRSERGFSTLPALLLFTAAPLLGILWLAVSWVAEAWRHRGLRRRSERGVVPVVVIVVIAIVALLGGGTAALVIAEHKGPIVLDCTEAKLSAGAAGIEGQVTTILAGGGDWEGALLALGARVGSDVVACAVTAILTPLDGGTRAALAPQVRANGEAFLTSHGYAVPR